MCPGKHRGDQGPSLLWLLHALGGLGSCSSHGALVVLWEGISDGQILARGQNAVQAKLGLTLRTTSFSSLFYFREHKNVDSAEG